MLHFYPKLFNYDEIDYKIMLNISHIPGSNFSYKNKLLKYANRIH